MRDYGEFGKGSGLYNERGKLQLDSIALHPAIRATAYFIKQKPSHKFQEVIHPSAIK